MAKPKWMKIKKSLMLGDDSKYQTPFNNSWKADPLRFALYADRWDNMLDDPGMLRGRTLAGVIQPSRVKSALYCLKAL